MEMLNLTLKPTTFEPARNKFRYHTIETRSFMDVLNTFS